VRPFLVLALDGSVAAGDLSPPTPSFHLGELAVGPVGNGAEPANSSELDLISGPLFRQAPPGHHLAEDGERDGRLDYHRGLYRKLGVSSRADALRRTRELGLL
jgi:hypothetical protein